MMELLAPAKDLDCGIAAISHGADAVYVGAPRFGARVAAGNTITDIEKLCNYAHLYHAQVHVTLNTILSDHELEEARQLIFALYEVGVDALIIQDTGILQLDLPPIALHASTQTDNRTVEKVRFWESVGVRRVILARELSLDQIKEIRQNTSIDLEAFVHGALCVSYSGQCYMSLACTGRSANRGECAQLCRLPYDLTDANGNLIKRHSHLLSLKDMNRSAHLRELAEAGICSFKIEGRLKDINYVKNTTAFYRQLMDQIQDDTPAHRHISSGSVAHFFTPNPDKTFNRGFTDYFLHQRGDILVDPDTPKSIGELLGNALKISGNILTIKTEKEIHNGDGLGFIDHNGDLQGVRVNKAIGNSVTTLEPIQGVRPGTAIFRNFDAEFDKLLRGNSAERKIDVDITLADTAEGFQLTLSDEDGISISLDISTKKEISQKGAVANDALRQSLSKLGGTPFRARQVSIDTSDFFFVPNSQVNEWRRNAVEALIHKRINAHIRPPARLPDTHTLAMPTPNGTAADYRANIMNSSAAEFYRQHGILSTAPAAEQGGNTDGVVMTCKHCIRFSLGFCPKVNPQKSLQEPLFISNGPHRFKLSFDCKRCEMSVQIDK